MDLTNEFRVGVSAPEAWKVLTDVERIAPMLPGAQLQEVDGDEYRGVVKVKVGPITAQYKGQATFVERDEAAGRVVLRASGRDTRGQGNASAIITATMTPDGDETKVSVVTDLTVTGKVAQFGRGVLAEVSAKLIGQFVDALHADLASTGVGDGSAAGSGGTGGTGTGTPDDSGAAESRPSASDAAPAGDAGADAEEAVASNGSGPEAARSSTAAGNGNTASSGPRRINSPDAEPVDLLAVAGGSTLKRLAPIVAVVLVFVVVRVRRRARKTRRDATRLARLGAALPSVSVPPVSGLTAHLPSVSDLASNLPSLSDLTANLPSVSDLASNLPSVSDLTANLPSVSDLASNLPSVSDLTDHLRDVRGSDVRSAVRRGRARARRRGRR